MTKGLLVTASVEIFLPHLNVFEAGLAECPVERAECRVRMGHSAFGLTMGYQEPVLELPVVYLFDSPSLRPQKLVAPET